MGLWEILVPEAGTNLVNNPIAFGSTGFAALGSATVTRVSTYAYAQWYSYRVQTAADNEGVSLTLTACANAIHYVSVRVQGTLPAAWDWSLDNSTYNAPSLVATEGDWSVYGYQFPAAQANASTTLYIRQNGAGSGDFYIGHVQVEQKTYATTPIHGYLENCYWNIAPNVSSSTRPLSDRSGGLWTDFDDYNFYLTEFRGAGAPPIEIHQESRALIDGADYLGQRTLAREIFMRGDLIGTSITNLHAVRKNLYNLIRNDLTPDNAPFWIRYTGVNTAAPLKIAVVYVDGLEGGIRQGFAESVVLRLFAPDPFFYEDGSLQVVALDTYDSQTANSGGGTVTVAHYKDGVWDFDDVDISTASLGGTIYKIAYDRTSGKVAVAGSNGVYERAAAGGWTDITTTGGTSTCYAAVYDLSGNLYVGGAFTTINGVSANYVAMWNGSTWAALSTGLSGACWELALGPNGNIYASDDGSGDVKYWDGSSWTAVGAAAASIRGLLYAPNGVLYYGDGSSKVKYWTGSAWTQLGGNFNSMVASLIMMDDGTLVVGGDFTTINGGANTANRIAKWNGTTWEAIGTGMNDRVYDLQKNSNNTIIGTGFFSTINGSTSSQVFIYDGQKLWDMDYKKTALQSRALERVSDSEFWYGGITQPASYDANGVTTATVSGTTRTVYPKIVFEGTGTARTLKAIENATTGAWIKLNYTLGGTETLTLDFTPGKRNITSNILGDNQWTIIKDESDFSNFYLADGDNVIKAYASAAMNCYLIWERTHSLFDGSAA